MFDLFDLVFKVDGLYYVCNEIIDVVCVIIYIFDDFKEVIFDKDVFILIWGIIWIFSNEEM